MKSDEKTSLVISASTIATIGGNNDQNVSYAAGTYSSPSAKAITGHSMIRAAADTMSKISLFLFFIFFSLKYKIP